MTARLFDLSRPYDRDELVLRGEKLGAQLGDAVQGIHAERTMQGASTLTMPVLDVSHGLLDETELFGRKQLKQGLSLTVDDYEWRLMELQKRRFGFEAVFYDEPSARMKLTEGALKASRDNMTRPQVMAWLCRKAGTPSQIPQLGEIPLIADLEDEDARALLDAIPTASAATRRKREKSNASLKTAPGLTVKGAGATSEQRRVAGKLLAVAAERKAGLKATKALILAGIVESRLTNLPRGDRDSRGVLQVRDSTAGPIGLDNRDVAACAEHFLDRGFYGLYSDGKPIPTGRGGAIKIAQDRRDLTAGQVAQSTQGSGRPDEYDKWSDEGDAWLEAGGSITAEAGASTPDRAFVETYELRVEADEDYLDAGTRFAEEVRWRMFSNLTAIVYADDFKLAEAPSLPTLVEGEDGCDEITWLWTARERIDELEATIRLSRWQVPPGGVITVKKEGPADGRHLLRAISRDLLDEGCSASASLGRPQAPLPEPASTVRTVQGSSPSSSTNGATAGGGTHDGKWKYGAGVPKTLNTRMKSFLDRMATFYEGSLIVTTTTNHSTNVAGTSRRSAHMGGGAADFGSVANWGGAVDGEGGFKIAIAAYRACGLSYSQARAKANVPSYDNVPCKEGHVQILWRVEGHHDHVHVGTG